MAAKMDFPLSDRWKPHLVDSTANAKVKVLEKDKYPEWLGRSLQVQADGNGRASEFKDGGSLMPNGDEPLWALAKDASDLYAFSSLPSKLPADRVYQIEMDGGVPSSAALSWLAATRSPRARVAARGGGSRSLRPSPCPPSRRGGDDRAERHVPLPRPDQCRVGRPGRARGVRTLARRRRRCRSRATPATSPSADPRRRSRGVGRRQPRLIDCAGARGRAARDAGRQGRCLTRSNTSSAAAMLTMKKDMGGAAHVLGVASMIMEAKLPEWLRASSRRSRPARRLPAAVLVARNGKTTETWNTDAEVSLVLADALVEACAERPELLVDCATLTGAGRVALGTDVPGSSPTRRGGGRRRVGGVVGDGAGPVRLPLWKATASRSTRRSPT